MPVGPPARLEDHGVGADLALAVVGGDERVQHHPAAERAAPLPRRLSVLASAYVLHCHRP
ncbi:MAG: hypothetical protein FWE35_04830 [Streptosporangiales bacterium]|nr:hypothetical protein [Streptosporangiales bacterium]